MSRFRSVGRLAFARGNSSWAKNFNANLLFARNMHSNQRSMAAAFSRMSTLLVAGEAPVACGFAEQFRDMTSSDVPCQDGGSKESELETEAQVDVSLDPNVEVRSLVLNHGGVCEIWSLTKSQITNQKQFFTTDT